MTICQALEKWPVGSSDNSLVGAPQALEGSACSAASPAVASVKSLVLLGNTDNKLSVPPAVLLYRGPCPLTRRLRRHPLPRGGEGAAASPRLTVDRRARVLSARTTCAGVFLRFAKKCSISVSRGAYSARGWPRSDHRVCDAQQPLAADTRGFSEIDVVRAAPQQRALLSLRDTDKVGATQFAAVPPSGWP